MTVLPQSSDSSAPDLEELGLWLGSGAVLLILATAGLFARRRVRQGEGEPPHRLLRIFHTAATFGGATALLLALDEVGGGEVRADLLPMMALAVLVMTIVGLILFTMVDFWLGLLRPRRTRPWLAAAVVLFGLLFVLLLAAAFWFADTAEILFQADLLHLLGVTSAAAIVWWAYLPAPRRNVAEPFE